MMLLPRLMTAALSLAGLAFSAVPAISAATENSSSADVPLSAAVQAKIAAMTPLFDGKSLQGWTQFPLAPLTFGGGDIADLPEFVRKLSHPADPVSAYLAGLLDEPTRSALAAGKGDAATEKKLRSTLAKFLNRVGADASLYDAARFANVTLRPETAALRQQAPAGAALLRLNRMLLEDAYPHVLTTSPLTSWVVKDGAMASTGAGRGVICTDRDYTHYRLIFLLRHVSGAPDHQPCVLIFCQRPAPGERGLDALGGIQFQVPNGGHWDYRTGHNNGGTGFVNPTKTRYNNHEWCQVELLVDARTGVARMAVASRPGLRGVENLDFKDAAAGHTGPIAWQMHNAGLFDEYKDVRIEVDPADDHLITAE